MRPTQTRLRPSEATSAHLIHGPRGRRSAMLQFSSEARSKKSSTGSVALSLATVAVPAQTVASSTVRSPAIPSQKPKAAQAPSVGEAAPAADRGEEPRYPPGRAGRAGAGGARRAA